VCPIGTEVGSHDGDGTSNATSCILCPAGRADHDLNPAQSCDACPNGRFAASATAPNEYMAIGATVCTACPAGQYANTHNEANTGTFDATTDCLDCAAGKYNNLEGQYVNNTPCKDCSSGYGVNEGATQNGSGCGICVAGKYAASGSACALCEKGKFTAQDGKSSCTMQTYYPNGDDPGWGKACHVETIKDFNGACASCDEDNSNQAASEVHLPYSDSTCCCSEGKTNGGKPTQRCVPV
jgi:hypothetical protein